MVISELTGYVFATGPNQANKYDNVYEYLLHYFGNKFIHRVYCTFECKAHMVGLPLLTKSTAPTTKKVVQEATHGDDSKLIGVKRTITNILRITWNTKWNFNST